MTTQTPPTPTAPLPVRRSLIEAVRERPQMVILPVLVLVVAAVIAGLMRNPVFTATTRLSVARIDATSPTGPGFQDGVANVANAYAELVDSHAVLAEAARTLGEEETAVAERVTAKAIPDSPLFNITATGSGATQARATADATANALRTHIAQLTSTNPDADRLFRDFQVASRGLATAEAGLTAARARLERTPSDGNRQRVVHAQAAVDAARLRADVLSGLYREALAGVASANIVQVVNPAREAVSDKRRTLIRYGAVALVAGLLLGLALALLAAGPAQRVSRTRAEPSL